jgi:hypothetical protein
VKQISSSKVLKLFWVENSYPQPSTSFEPRFGNHLHTSFLEEKTKILFQSLKTLEG